MAGVTLKVTYNNPLIVLKKEKTSITRTTWENSTSIVQGDQSINTYWLRVLPGSKKWGKKMSS